MAKYTLITPAQLGRGAIGTVVSTFYTVSTLERIIIKTIDICNNVTTSLDVTVYLVPNGGTPNFSNTLMPGITLKEKQMFQWIGSQVLNSGDTIRCVASNTGSTINISGAVCI